MARHETDREDLYAEATAYVRKMELCRPNDSTPSIVAGYRGNGQLTVYLHPEEMYQFTSAGKLRRAYVQGALYRTQGHTLARLIRRRTENVTELVRHDLTADELQYFLSTMEHHLHAFLDELKKDCFRVARQEPLQWDSRASLVESLAMILSDAIQLESAIPTKRR